MFTVTKHTTQTLEIKQSKFIAHVMPYKVYKELLYQLKNEHTKARHFVTAFRYMNEFDQIIEGSSDDGEPKGTSGKPTLSVLQGQNLIDIAIVTVRYFGGTKLGTGGLVRAYSDATNLVLEHAELVSYVKLELLIFYVNYSDLRIIEYTLDQAGIKQSDKKFEATEVSISISAEREALEIFQNSVNRLIRVI